MNWTLTTLFLNAIEFNLVDDWEKFENEDFRRLLVKGIPLVGANALNGKPGTMF